MRIIGEIPHPELKITVFRMDNRFTLKLENEGFEQSYKLYADERINGLEEIKKLVDEAFLAKALLVMNEMQKNAQESFTRNLSSKYDSDEFETII